MTKEKEETKFTQKAFARKCGLSKQAINKAIHSSPPTLVLNSQDKIDIEFPTNRAYLENAEKHLSKKRAQTKEEPSTDGEKTLDELNKEKKAEDIVKVRIDNQRKLNELVPREDAKKVFSEMYTIHQTGFLNMGRSLTPLIMAICEVTAPGKEVEISEAVTTAVYQHLARIKLEINNFLKEYPVEDQIGGGS